MSIASGNPALERLSDWVLLPGDAAYDAARVSFNGMIDRRPAMIVQHTRGR